MAAIRAFVMSSVVRFIFVFLRPALKEKVVISCIAPSPSAGRIDSACACHTTCLLTTIFNIILGQELTIPHTSVIVRAGQVMVAQGAEPSRKSSSAPTCASVVWFYLSGCTPFH